MKCSLRNNFFLFQPISSDPRCPLQQLLPSVSPAPPDAAEETPPPGSAAAQRPGSRFGAACALLCGLPPLWKRCVAAALQRVCQENINEKILSSAEEGRGYCVRNKNGDSRPRNKTPN